MENAWVAVFGGVLIGLAAAALLLFNGRFAGISGIVNAMLAHPVAGEWAWRIAFLAGLMGAGAVAMRVLGQSTPSPASTPMLLVAGLLVGYGTSLGSGCTSGHGVCGLGRFSRRSLVAVLVFMAAGMATVFALRHLWGGGA